MAYYAGVDLGGTKVAVGLLDLAAGRLIAEETIPTRSQEGPDAVIARMAEVMRGLVAQAGVRLAGAGVGAPAVIDYERGLTLLVPNMAGWYGYPVVANLSAQIGVPVALVNDARAFTLAEAKLGAGRAASMVAGFTLGTGVGGGIAVEGRLFMGLKGAAGEFGHQTVHPEGPRCGCGNYGCLEMFTSGPSLVRAAITLLADHPTSALYTLTQHDLTRLTPDLLLQAAEGGDTAAQAVLTQAGRYLGIGFSNVLTILSADCIVVGGGVAQLGDWLLQPAWRALRERCHTVDLDQVRIVQAALGHQAGIIGAALWAVQQLA